MISDLRTNTVKLGNLLTIAEQIQAFGMARKTGEIYITNVAPPARINLVEGEIVDAQFGLRSGIEAAIALINLPDPQTEFIVGEKPPRRTITVPYMEVLLEAARVNDEERTIPTIERPREPLNSRRPIPSCASRSATRSCTFPDPARRHHHRPLDRSTTSSSTTPPSRSATPPSSTRATASCSRDLGSIQRHLRRGPADPGKVARPSRTAFSSARCICSFIGGLQAGRGLIQPLGICHFFVLSKRSAGLSSA